MENSQQIKPSVVVSLGGCLFVKATHPHNGDANDTLQAMSLFPSAKFQEMFSNCLVLAWNETFKALAEQDPRVKVQEIEDASDLFF